MYSPYKAHFRRSLHVPFALQVLLDLARIIFEEQSTIERVVQRILVHALSFLQCQRCQVSAAKSTIYIRSASVLVDILTVFDGSKV